MRLPAFNRISPAPRGITAGSADMNVRPAQASPGAWSSPSLPNLSASHSVQAFSLTEMMVTVTLLTVIILGLVAMFDQTRRAFTAGLSQVDVLESGRAAADLIGRDLEQLSPAYFASVTNFYSDTPPFYYANNNFGGTGPVMQPLPSPNAVEQRTNTLQELYFLTRNSQQWTAIGYKLDYTNQLNGVATLYRYSMGGLSITNATNYYNLTNQLATFTSIWPFTGSNFNRIIDGVVHFRVQAFGPNGVTFTNISPAALVTNIYTIPPVPGHNNQLDNSYVYAFSSNAVPAFVEVELGILETRAYQKYMALLTAPNAPAAAAYLSNNAARVHIFRQRVPIRSVDPTAYP